MTAVSLTTSISTDAGSVRASDPPAWTERVERFGQEPPLVAIVTEPAPGRRRQGGPACVFISAGMVHRVGPNRMYVNLARQLAEAGLVAVRFDLSGIGDSNHRSDGLPADESAVLETVDVMTAVQTRWGCQTFVLLGLCSGAVTAFRTALRDTRVVGAVLLNPQRFDHDPAWNEQVENRHEAKRYARGAVLDPSRWVRALTGRIDYRRLLGVMVRRIRTAGPRDSAKSPIAAALASGFHELTARGARLLVVCSERDSSVDYMTAILGKDAFRDPHAGALTLRLFQRTDHSLTPTASQREFLTLVSAWVSPFHRVQS